MGSRTPMRRGRPSRRGGRPIRRGRPVPRRRARKSFADYKRRAENTASFADYKKKAEDTVSPRRAAPASETYFDRDRFNAVKEGRVTLSRNEDGNVEAKPRNSGDRGRKFGEFLAAMKR